MTAAHLERLLDCRGDELLRLVHRCQGIASFGEPSRDGRGKDAAAAVGVRGCHPWRLKLDKLRAVDAYVAPVRVTSDRRVLPGNLREQIRSNGPTVALPGES